MEFFREMCIQTGGNFNIRVFNLCVFKRVLRFCG